MEDGVVADDHGDEREAEGDDQEDDRVGQGGRPAEEAGPVRLLVLVPDEEEKKEKKKEIREGYSQPASWCEML